MHDRRFFVGQRCALGGGEPWQESPAQVQHARARARRRSAGGYSGGWPRCSYCYIITWIRRPCCSILLLQDGHERLLRDVDAADALEALFAFLLLFQELALSGDVAAVALGGDVFADGLDGLAGDDLAADRRLERDLEQVAVVCFLHEDKQPVAAGLRVVGENAYDTHDNRVRTAD